MDLKPVLAVAAAVGVAYVLTRKSDDASAASNAPALDAGLSADENAAVQKALSQETLAVNLNGFADSLDPDFPLAAAALRQKAMNLQGAPTTGGEPCCHECAEGTKPPCTPIVTGPSLRIGLPTRLS